MLFIVKEIELFYSSNRVSDNVPVGVLLLRRRPIKKYYLIPLSQSRSRCPLADQKALRLCLTLVCRCDLIVNVD